MAEMNLEFVKNKVKEKLSEIKDSISSTKYRLYCAMIDDCSTLEDVTELCELRLPIDVHNYVRGVLGELETLGTTVEEISATVSRHSRIARLNIVYPENLPAENYSAEDIIEMLDDERIISNVKKIAEYNEKDVPDYEISHREYMERERIREENILLESRDAYIDDMSDDEIETLGEEMFGKSETRESEDETDEEVDCDWIEEFIGNENDNEDAGWDVIFNNETSEEEIEADEEFDETELFGGNEQDNEEDETEEEIDDITEEELFGTLDADDENIDSTNDTGKRELSLSSIEEIEADGDDEEIDFDSESVDTTKENTDSTSDDDELPDDEDMQDFLTFIDEEDTENDTSDTDDIDYNELEEELGAVEDNEYEESSENDTGDEVEEASDEDVLDSLFGGDGENDSEQDEDSVDIEDASDEDVFESLFGDGGDDESENDDDGEEDDDIDDIDPNELFGYENDDEDSNVKNTRTSSVSRENVVTPPKIGKNGVRAIFDNGTNKGKKTQDMFDLLSNVVSKTFNIK